MWNPAWLKQSPAASGTGQALVGVNRCARVMAALLDSAAPSLL